MYKRLLLGSFAFVIACAASPTSDRVRSTDRLPPDQPSRTCGGEICAPDEHCVASAGFGYRCQ